MLPNKQGIALERAPGNAFRARYGAAMGSHQPRRRQEPVPSTEGAAPDSGERFTPDRGVTAQIQEVAAARAAGWRLCVELFSPPTPDCADRLRSGDLLADLRAAVAWLGPEAERFLPVEMVLDTIVRRSRRRTHGEDLDQFTDAYRTLWPEGVVWLPRFEWMVEVCDEEADAWRRGDHEAAKVLRVGQQEYLEKELVPDFPTWAGGVDVSTTVMLYRIAARFVVTHLSFETGRDFERAIFGSSSPLGW